MRYWDIQFSLSVNLSLSAPHLNELAGYEIPSTLLDTLPGINRPPLAADKFIKQFCYNIDVVPTRPIE
jgi:hypothetical protein